MPLLRVLSVSFAGFAVWAALMQLNDPDPERWFAVYAVAAAIGAACVIGRPLPRATGVLGIVALLWAAALVPALIGHWHVRDLGAAMSRERPEIELGRELGGLLIVASYCALALSCARPPRSPRDAAGGRRTRPSSSAT
jgi:hypothetical protein